jgi:hypothetical protein
MRMRATRAPQALPALITGIVAVLLALFVAPLFAWIAGAGALTLAGLAWADTKDHGYDGREMAIAGAVLGVLAVLISLLGFALV